MKRILSAAIVCIAALISYTSGASAFEAGILPSRVHPGDAFVLRVISAPEMPEAQFKGRPMKFAPCGERCWYGVSAVELGTEAGSYGLTVVSAGESRKVPVKVVAKKFPVIKLTLPKGKVTLSAEDEARADRETAMLKALWKKSTDKKWNGLFALPVNNGLSTGFGVKRIMNGVKTSVHTGLDMRGKRGEQVVAANSGTVVVADELFFGGNTVVIDHGLGIYTVYMHLDEYRVSVGDSVWGGRVVGLVGSSGRATGPHLHFAVKVGPVSTNPIAFMKLPL